jgi:hypothetical protein
MHELERKEGLKDRLSDGTEVKGLGEEQICMGTVQLSIVYVPMYRLYCTTYRPSAVLPSIVLPTSQRVHRALGVAASEQTLR